MRSGDVRRIERLESRRRAATPIHRPTEAELDRWERDFVTRLRDQLGAAWQPFLDGLLALPAQPLIGSFGRAAGFLLFYVDATLKGDEGQVVRYRHLLDGRLREEYPALWPLYPDRIEDEPLIPDVRAAPPHAQGGARRRRATARDWHDWSPARNGGPRRRLCPCRIVITTPSSARSSAAWWRSRTSGRDIRRPSPRCGSRSTQRRRPLSDADAASAPDAHEPHPPLGRLTWSQLNAAEGDSPGGSGTKRTQRR